MRITVNESPIYPPTSSLKLSVIPFKTPSPLLLLRSLSPLLVRACRYGNPRPTIRHGGGKLKSNGSRPEEVQEEIEDDDTFFQLMEEDIDDEDDDDTESSLDLLFRFLYSMFKKLCKRARKASRAVLPQVISPQLVVCTVGGIVFVIVLMLREIWAAVSYFQSSANNFNQSGPSYNRTQPIT